MTTDMSTTASDTDILDTAASVISTPRMEEGDSFVIHAPLEVLARSGLLPLAAPESRGDVRALITAVADTYRDWGTPVRRPAQQATVRPTDAQQVLHQAIAAGDLDRLDDTVAWLATHLGTDELTSALAPAVLPSLAAAAHGPILLHLLSSTTPRSLAAATMARTTMRELARHPTWNFTWLDTFETTRPHAVSGDPDEQTALGAELATRLSTPVLVEQPDSTFIYPTMAAVDRSGLAAATLADLAPQLTVATARRQLLRVAAQSMLQDAPAHAPYGWSHCLTMPQAALSIAHTTHHPAQAIAVAATYLLGFRATLSETAVDPHLTPEPADAAPSEIISASPAEAAAAAWHAPTDRHRLIWRTLATNAATHPDAHLAKYTLACLDAARADPDDEHLYRAAAAYLNAWWHHNGRNT